MVHYFLPFKKNAPTKLLNAGENTGRFMFSISASIYGRSDACWQYQNHIIRTPLLQRMNRCHLTKEARGFVFIYDCSSYVRSIIRKGMSFSEKVIRLFIIYRMRYLIGYSVNTNVFI